MMEATNTRHTSVDSFWEDAPSTAADGAAVVLLDAQLQLNCPSNTKTTMSNVNGGRLSIAPSTAADGAAVVLFDASVVVNFDRKHKTEHTTAAAFIDDMPVVVSNLFICANPM